jgi:hypothetical protein
MKWFKNLFNTTDDEITPFDSGYFYTGTEKKWGNLTNEKLSYVLEESRLYLQHIWDGTTFLIQKALFLLTLITAGIGFLFTEFMMRYEWFESHLWITFILVGYFIVLLYIFLKLIKYFLPSLDYEAIGNYPKILLKNEGMMEYDYKKIIVSQLELYQDKINRNFKQNKQFAFAIKYTLWWLVAYPSIVVAVVFIVFLLSFYY